MLPISPVRITPPAVPVVTVVELARHARIDFADDNALLEGLIQAATDHFDGHSGILGRCLVNQGWRQDLTCWHREVQLPFPDVSAIVSVVYSDSDNAEQTVDGGLYALKETALGTVLRFGDAFSMPSLYGDRPDPVRITFTAGYGAAASDVPAALRVAVMMLAAHWYDNREGHGEIPPAVAALAAPYRRVGV